MYLCEVEKERDEIGNSITILLESRKLIAFLGYYKTILKDR